MGSAANARLVTNIKAVVVSMFRMEGVCVREGKASNFRRHRLGARCCERCIFDGLVPGRSMHHVMGDPHADPAARAMSLFFNLEIVLVDFVADFEFRVAHRARGMLHQESALTGLRRCLSKSFFELVHPILRDRFANSRRARVLIFVLADPVMQKRVPRSMVGEGGT